jgi:hypothetical protein
MGMLRQRPNTIFRRERIKPPTEHVVLSGGLDVSGWEGYTSETFGAWRSW